MTGQRAMAVMMRYGYDHSQLATGALTVGESTIIFNARESAASPGVYTAFPGITLDSSGQPLACYYRGLGHLTPESSQRIVRTVNGGRTWDQLGEEDVINTPYSVATTAASVTANVCTVTVASHTLTTNDWIYTTGLTQNIASGSSVQITGTTSTSISFPMVRANGALADGVGEVINAGCFRGPRPIRFSSGRIGLLYSFRNLLDNNPTGVRYQYSDDDGETWSAPVTLPQLGSHTDTFAGSSMVELGDGTVLATVYGRTVDYESAIFESPDTTGATWAYRSTIALTPGLQYETPNLGQLADGRLMCLIREDTTGQTYRNYSSDDGETWTTPEPVFPTRRLPFWKQTANGTIVALASPETGPGTRVGQLYWSRDSGSTWQGPIEYLPTNPDTATNDQEEGDLIEVSPNLLGILSGQEVTANSASRLIYTEVGVGIAPPVRFRNSQAALWPSTNDSFADFGNAAHLSAATEATFEIFYRRDSTLGGTQRLISHAATGQFHYSILVNVSNQIVIQIASSLTAFANYATLTTVQNDVTYHIVGRYLGAGIGNAQRLRVWINGVEDTGGSYGGTIPAAMTSPNATAVFRIGGYAPSASQNLRDSSLAFVRAWATALDPADVSTLYNNRAPLSMAEANGVVGSAAIYSFRLDGDWTDEAGLFGAPAITGTVGFSGRWVP